MFGIRTLRERERGGETERTGGAIREERSGATNRQMWPPEKKPQTENKNRTFPPLLSACASGRLAAAVHRGVHVNARASEGRTCCF